MQQSLVAVTVTRQFLMHGAWLVLVAGAASVKKMMESSSPLKDAKQTYDAVFVAGRRGGSVSLPSLLTV